MSRRRDGAMRLRLMAAALLTAAVVAWAVGVDQVVSSLQHAHSGDFGTPAGDLVAGVSLLAFALVGYVVVRARPTDLTGWALLVAGLSVELFGAAESDRAGLLFAGLVLGVVPLVFPSGRFASPLWRRFGLVQLGLVAALVVLPVLAPALFVVVAIGLAGLVQRARHSDSEQRRQLRWLGAGVVVVVAVFAGLAVLGLSLPRPTPLWFRIANDLAGLLVAVIPVSIGVAVLQRRSGRADAIADRALVVLGVSVFASAVYVALVVGVGSMVGHGSDVWLLVVASVVLAVCIDPVRRLARRGADRVVYGSPVDPYRMLADFSRRVAASYSGEEALLACARTAAQACGAQSASVWSRRGEDWTRVATWPAGSSLPSGAGPANATSLPVRLGDELLGAVEVDTPRLLPTQRQALAELADSSAMLLRSVGLTSDLQVRLDQLATQAEELRASRARILTSEDRARRTIERDLHDGVQQRLVVLSLTVQRLGAALDDRAAAVALAERAADELRCALAELRDLARGIHPRLLVEAGLGDAVGALVERSATPARVRAGPSRRYRADVETAAYYVIAEALTNAAKHAPGAHVEVSITDSGPTVVVPVADDGPGGADLAAGTGLAGLRDRVAAVGGRLTVESEPGQGTVVEAVLPCG